jgi:hypothetical protein
MVLPPRFTELLLVLALLAGLLPTLGPPRSPGAEKPPKPAFVFEKDVQPILQARCFRCHGDKTQKAGLDLRSKHGLLEGGDTGPAIVPGKPEQSLLWTKVAADQMPPDQPRLTAREKLILRSWIEAGAPGLRGPSPPSTNTPKEQPITDADRRFWAFRPPTRPAVPAIRHAQRVRNPIDAFIRAPLETRGLTLSPEADRLTLIRRVSFDLTGLPPSPAEIDAFLKDMADNAYERLVDRLLASPDYGEHWARHWLDLAGYADSEGILDADYVRSAAWRYRDYVIAAFNHDKPYDRFLLEQLAGDELTDYWTAYHTHPKLTPEIVEALTATGFLRCASDTSRPDFVNIKNAPGYYYQTLDDTVKIFASATLGLTIQCARCHNHKYDPIPQADYYHLQAVFMSGYRPSQWVPQVQRRLLQASEAQEKDARRHNAQVDARIASLLAQLRQIEQQFAGRLFEDRLARLPAPIQGDVRAALAATPAQRNEVQKYLTAKFQGDLRPDAARLPQILAAVYAEYRSHKETLAAAIQAQKSNYRQLEEIRAFYDLPGEPRTPVLRRGDYRNPGPEVPPGILSVLATDQPFLWKVPPRGAATSGRRLALARWLVQPNHPLTTRVLVNRLWLHHFGEGIVPTPDNFGKAGSRPSHPELLDWLATEFVRRGWSIKAMHRLILTSSTYRQVCNGHPDLSARARRIDPDNRLLWRQRLRRLSAEQMRDAVLAVAGTLNRQMAGPPVSMLRQGDGEVTVSADLAGQRRSVYLQVRRSQPLTFLQVFDQPVMETNCTRRSRSTVASQALTLLNSDFTTRQAQAFADRLKNYPLAPADHALRLAFQRPASAGERARLGSFLESQAARYVRDQSDGEQARRFALIDLCHMLLSANEFAYVD